MSHRVAVLDADACQPRKCGLECVKYCPVNKSGADCVAVDEQTGKARIDENICNGCGICVKVCPFDAITVVNLASETGRDKIHQYGRNSFRLYRLPSPKKGEVVGLLGRNGMGKSTVVGILSGTLTPNLGRYEDPPGWDAVLDYYAGTELKSHFESVLGGARVSIKPQQVHQVARAFDGTGAQLVEKYGDPGRAGAVTEQLGLDGVLGRSTSEMSGGELQRLSVAVAASRDADLYFFDEPSSYNDVFQRLAVARVIRSLAAEGRSVVVVEHDLTLLDYLCDHIDVLYGEPSAYGIVSGLLSTKVGINVFLDGYLPAENVRFRDKAFSMDASTSGADEFQEGSEIAAYPGFTKKYDGFELEAEAGRVRRGEIVGVVGANSLGKTTMMRVIAGGLAPDSGGPVPKASISYKPQYLEQDSDAEVLSVLDMACGSQLEGSLDEEQVAGPLRIKKLYSRRISDLSGGELQKVAVAACLLRKADLYALDEPSAFLDVEDRIAVAKFLQKFARSFGKAALVIDHDLQLMSLVSDTVVLFEGEPGRHGHASAPMPKSEAMNRFLESLQISFRRDEKSGRPRVNKSGSRLDKEQKAAGDFYYAR